MFILVDWVVVFDFGCLFDVGIFDEVWECCFCYWELLLFVLDFVDDLVVVECLLVC